MNKKSMKKVLVIIALVIFLFAIYELVKTYAVFYTEATANVRQNQANWTIEVNGQNVVSKIEQQFTINQIDISNNAHVKAGKFAPSLTGDFYITIDPKNTDVAIKYDITLDKTSLTNSKINILTIKEILQNNNLIKTAENTYTGIISLADIKAGKTNKIDFGITWDNDEANNAADTEVGTKTNPSIQIPIVVDITQYLGETIVNYTP